MTDPPGPWHLMLCSLLDLPAPPLPALPELPGRRVAAPDPAGDQHAAGWNKQHPDRASPAECEPRRRGRPRNLNPRGAGLRGEAPPAGEKDKHHEPE